MQVRGQAGREVEDAAAVQRVNPAAGANALKTTSKWIRRSSSSANAIYPTCMRSNCSWILQPNKGYCNVLKDFWLQYLLLVSVGALWRSSHVQGRCKRPHPGGRKPWVGFLGEVRWGLVEAAYRVSAECQKTCHGVWWGTPQAQPGSWSPAEQPLTCPWTQEGAIALAQTQYPNCRGTSCSRRSLRLCEDRQGTRSRTSHGKFMPFLLSLV